jgi:hypothetical protein
MSRSKLLGAVFALPLMFAGATSAQANIIALVIDGSGSISGANFAAQKTGYINAINNLVLADGQNTIGVWQFSTGVQLEFALTTMNSAADITALTTAINNMTQLGNFTAVGDAINTATTAINAFVGGSGSKIIDVSTDGFSNTGADPTTAANNAWTISGIKVNCLGVGVGANCDFNNAAGVGTDFPAASFADFEAVLTAKLSSELTPTPEPLTMSLFGAGLVGAAALRRRKMKTA